DKVDHGKLMDDVADFFRLARADVEQMFATYQAFHDAQGYAVRLGELKTLCFEEAFVLGAALSLTRPRVIAEIGTQHGKSTRRLLDLNQFLSLGARFVCFDVADEVKHFTRDEAELVVQELTGRFQEQVLDAYAPDLVFVDVHSYALLKEIVAAM